MTRALLLLALVACSGGDERPRPALRTIYAAATDDLGEVAAIAKVMQRRLDRLEVRGTARAEGREIVVELPALDAVRLARTRAVLARGGRLAFHVVDSDLATMAPIEAWVRADPRGAADVGVTRGDWRDGAGRGHDEIFLTGADPEAVTRALAAARLTIPDDRRLVFEEMKPGRWRSYLIVRDPALTGEHIASARVRGEELEVVLDGEGRRIFAELTERHVGEKLAIVVDDRVSSAPVIFEPIRGGTVRIVAADRDDAAELAVVLDSGALPAPVLEQSSEPLR